jgi:CheY-like chemotaxis protein
MDLLVVDDEAEVRASLALVLRDRGYPVSETGSGGEALAWLDQGHALDALVTDLAMPEMDGLTLIQEARRRRPGLPALLVTGHAGTASKAAMEAARLGGPFRILQKPVAPGALTDALATLLSSADRPADAAQPGRQSARPGQVA